MQSDDVPDRLVENVPVADAVLVSSETRIGRQVAATEDVAKHCPFALVLDRQDDVAVGGTEHSVWRDGRMREPEPARLHSAIAARQVGNVHEFRHGVEQGHLQVRPPAGPLASQQRLKDRGESSLTSHDVANGNADAARS